MYYERTGKALKRRSPAASCAAGSVEDVGEPA